MRKNLCAIPSAAGEPRWALHMSDNKCREKGSKFCQIASVVTEGGAARTINVCKPVFQCVAAKAGRTRSAGIKVERAGQQFVRIMCERFTVKKNLGGVVLTDAECVRRNGTGQVATRNVVHGGARPCQAQQWPAF